MADEHLTIMLKSPKSDAPQQPLRKKKGGTKRVVTLLALLVVFAVIGLIGFVIFTKFSGTQDKRSSDNGVQANTQTTTTQGDDTQQLINRVGALMLLPDEKPTVAVVSDLGKLKGQRFFANAKEGDVVLMYAHAQKAILYSPTLNKIIEVAPITNDTQQ
jgi:hypothetical protein